jgi:nitric oxide reductase subunit C
MPGRIMPLVVLVVLALSLVACGDGASPTPSAPTAAPSGNAANGKTLFTQPVIANGPGCATCHAVEPGKTVVGPSLAGLAARAPEIVQRSGYKGTAGNAAEYLHESIVDPDVYTEEGFSPGVMPKNYKDLSAQELDDLVAYLLTLK